MGSTIIYNQYLSKFTILNRHSRFNQEVNDYFENLRQSLDNPSEFAICHGISFLNFTNNIVYALNHLLKYPYNETISEMLFYICGTIASVTRMDCKTEIRKLRTNSQYLRCDTFVSSFVNRVQSAHQNISYAIYQLERCAADCVDGINKLREMADCSNEIVDYLNNSMINLRLGYKRVNASIGEAYDPNGFSVHHNNNTEKILVLDESMDSIAITNIRALTLDDSIPQLSDGHEYGIYIWSAWHNKYEDFIYTSICDLPLQKDCRESNCKVFYCDYVSGEYVQFN